MTIFSCYAAITITERPEDQVFTKHAFSKKTQFFPLLIRQQEHQKSASKRLLFFLFVFLKDYWPFPSPRKDSQISFLSVSFRGSWISGGGSEMRREVSEREKNKKEGKESVYHPLPFPLAVFPVRISLHRPNNLDAWKHFTSLMCTPSKQFARKCFSPFYF